MQLQIHKNKRNDVHHKILKLLGTTKIIVKCKNISLLNGAKEIVCSTKLLKLLDSATTIRKSSQEAIWENQNTI